MDTFALSLLPAAAEAGLDTTTISRHVPVFRRDVGRNARTLAIARCSEPDRRLQGTLLLLVTRQRLVVTRQTRVFDRVRPHLSAGFSELSDVAWAPDYAKARMDLRFRLRERTHHLRLRVPARGQWGRLTTALETALGARIPRQR